MPYITTFNKIKDNINMSRTIRRYRGRTGKDGKPDWRTLIARDNRVTGLRNHRQHRQATRISLKTGEDTALSGKHRRYSLRYGRYIY